MPLAAETKPYPSSSASRLGLQRTMAIALEEGMREIWQRRCTMLQMYVERDCAAQGLALNKLLI